MIFLLRGHAGQGLLHQKCQEFLRSLFPSSNHHSPNHRQVNTFIHIFIEQWCQNWASPPIHTNGMIFLYNLILYPCRTLCPNVICDSLSIFLLLYYTNNHVTGACTGHVPWIQAAMDSDSSAREAALHKRRERD